MSDIKPALERAGTGVFTEPSMEPRSVADQRALAACVRDLAEAAREMLEPWMGADDGWRRTQNLRAALAKWGLSGEGLREAREALSQGQHEAIAYLLDEDIDDVRRVSEGSEPHDSYPEDAEYAVWWWDEQDQKHLPVPQQVRVDTKTEAIRVCHEMTKDAPPWLAWVKAFRSDNEHYEVFRWERDSGLIQAHPLSEGSEG
jgi:hypothetical protein